MNPKTPKAVKPKQKKIKPVKAWAIVSPYFRPTTPFCGEFYFAKSRAEYWLQKNWGEGCMVVPFLITFPLTNKRKQ
jgi:hypothetical protein